MIIKRWTGTALVEEYPKTTTGMIVASGTPNSTTFLRGDGTWNTPINTNNYLNSVSGTIGGTITFSREGLTNLTWDSAHTHNYEPIITAGTAGQYWRGDKTWQTTPTSNATHTGDVTGSTELTIASGAVTLTKMANMSANLILGRISVGTGVPEALSADNVKTILSLSNVTNNAQLPIAGGTMTGILYPQQNTSYTTGQARRIILSTGDPTGGGNGDVWIKYTA